MNYIRIPFLLSICVVSLFAIDPEDEMLYSQGSKMLFDKEQKTATQGVTQEIDAQIQNSMTQKGKEAVAASGSGSSDVMIVDPKIVSKDWVDAFAALQAKKVQGLTFFLKSNPPISDVSSIQAMPGGYLMLFTIKTVQGPRYRIVKTSDITTLSTE